MTPVYMTVRERAGAFCECCGQPFEGDYGGARQMDHFFGRAKADESVETCWMLRTDCHADKTANRPRAAHWLRLFIAHCARYDYAESEERAMKRLEFIHAKAAFVK